MADDEPTILYTYEVPDACFLFGTHLLGGGPQNAHTPSESDLPAFTKLCLVDCALVMRLQPQCLVTNRRRSSSNI